MGLYQTKTLAMTKRTIDRVQNPSMGWEKILGNYSSDRGLIFRIYKELIKFLKIMQLINVQMIKTLLKWPKNIENVQHH